MKKRSFFERLSGSVPVSDDYDAFEDDLPLQRRQPAVPAQQIPIHQSVASAQPQTAFLHQEDEPAEGQLPVDVYQTPSEIVIRTFIAGVRPDEINLSISRDMVVIEGARAERESIIDSDYFNRELFWGTFSRTILLPQEIDVDSASATAKDGLLTLILPKLDKAKQTKLKVRA
ncbi:MAG TPA: Hsp20/alpha crystallin family protein, partial [Candidatus Paceibacterota bacterium]|nr:Hsp20/alpha crystallin family protein [Candidatus Paceibacterota bacterium]